MHAGLTRRLALAGAAAVLAAPARAQAPAVQRVAWRDAARGRDLPVLLRPAARGGTAPCVLLSHGLGGSREGLSWLGEVLAERGYAVVQLQHPGSDASALAGGNRGAAVVAALTPEVALDRLRDIVFALAECGRRAAELGIDPRRFALGGHSYGAWTVQHALGQRLPGRAGEGLALPDARVLAGIAMSPTPPMGLPARLVFANVVTPILHLTGTQDHGVIEGVGPSDRRIPYDGITRAPQALAILNGADHFAFAGEGPDWVRERSAPYTPRAAALAGLFLDAFVRRDAAARARLAGGQVRPPLLGADTFEGRGF